MADGDMAVVNSWYEEFGGNDINKVQATIRKSVQETQFENVSFIVFAHEYAANPDDKKFFSFIYLYFRENAPFELNLGRETSQKISKLLNDPEIKGKDIIETKMASGITLHPIPVPVTLNADELQKKGGFKQGAAGNYNLAIKALDLASKKLVSDMGLYIRAALKNPTPGTNVNVKTEMVNAYKQLVPFWGDSDLCKFGFTER